MSLHTSPHSPSGRVPRTRGSRVAAVAVTGAGVIAIAGCATALSYNGIYQLALHGNVGERLAHLYPAVFTVLLLLCFATSYIMRDASRGRRWLVDLLTLALIGLGAAASGVRLLDYRVTDTAATVIAAVAPWLALLVAFRVWLWIVAHVRAERAGPPRPAGDGVAETPPDTVPALPKRTPGGGEHPGTVTRPVVPVTDPRETAADGRDAHEDRDAPAAAGATDPPADEPEAPAVPETEAPPHSTEPAAAADEGPDEAPTDTDAAPVAEDEGFVADPSVDDPVTDEGHAPADRPEETPAASLVRKRPIVYRPRRGGDADVPTDPPSGRVRSAPTPPKE